VSTESGIPDFRGPNGYWTVGSRSYMPQQLATRAEFQRQPQLVWDWYRHRLRAYQHCAPNPAHHALAQLGQALGARMTLITQNVDGLHGRAGSPQETTYAIHGDIRWMRCLAECTRALVEIPQPFIHAEAAAPPRCPHCQGLMRPHVLWFDEVYDEPYFRFHSSLRAAERAHLLLTVGSSAQTNLPVQVTRVAEAAGAGHIDINLEDNDFAEWARASGGVALRGRAGALLPGLVAEIAGALGVELPP
jgi:NAD-dependent deacetylase